MEVEIKMLLVDGVTKRFGTKEVLHKIHLELEDGMFLDCWEAMVREKQH